MSDMTTGKVLVSGWIRDKGRLQAPIVALRVRYRIRTLRQERFRVVVVRHAQAPALFVGEPVHAREGEESLGFPVWIPHARDVERMIATSDRLAPRTCP
jgi:hypothetical protein